MSKLVEPMQVDESCREMVPIGAPDEGGRSPLLTSPVEELTIFDSLKEIMGNSSNNNSDYFFTEALTPPSPRMPIIKQSHEFFHTGSNSYFSNTVHLTPVAYIPLQDEDYYNIFEEKQNQFLEKGIILSFFSFAFLFFSSRKSIMVNNFLDNCIIADSPPPQKKKAIFFEEGVFCISFQLLPFTILSQLNENPSLKILYVHHSFFPLPRRSSLHLINLFLSYLFPSNTLSSIFLSSPILQVIILFPLPWLVFLQFMYCIS